MRAPALKPARLGAVDVLRVGGSGLRSRPLRVLLSALGIAIGIAAMVAVVGISASSQEQLNRRLDALGTNLLTAGPGQTLFGEDARVPPESIDMVERIAPVMAVSAIGSVDAKVYRNDLIPAAESGGIAVLAATLDLPQTVSADLETGTWLNPATERYPAVVLGASAAARLGVGEAGPNQQLWLGDTTFTVVGILAPVALAPELDTAALIGEPVARLLLGHEGDLTTIYTRADQAAVTDVQQVLARTISPENPNEVDVSRPSDALAAQQATDEALGGLLLGLAAVALLVGGVGVANTMVISVLERRGEIGLRRALGATRGQIRTQFLAESLLLSALGGFAGVLIGIVVTTAYATYQDWPSVVPAWVMLGGLGATLVIGGFAGLYPAVRASRQAPTEALAAT